MVIMRKASDVEGGFPYKSKHICYIELTNNKELRQIPNYKKDKQEIYYRVKNKYSKLYAVWPGTYTSDLFEIDDIELYVQEFI